MGVQPGDIILSYSGTILDSSVNLVTKSPWSHAALVADPVKRLTIEARAFHDVCYHSLDDYRYNSIVLRVPGITPEQQNKILQYAKAQLGKPYDYQTILKELMRFELGVKLKEEENPEAFICSTLVATSYLHAGIRITDQPVAAPSDLFISKKLAVVGRLGVDL
jgi:uncharacterized protein YycO